MTKSVLRDAGVPTPDFAVVEAESDLIELEKKLAYPLFAKPVAEGTGKGITVASKIGSPAELSVVRRELMNRFRQPVLVETYLPGREFTVGILGTGAQAKVVGVMEILLEDKAEPEAYTYFNKENYESLVTYRLVDDGQARSAARTALEAYRILGCRDAARVDLRGDCFDVPNFMEINPLAGLHPVHSDLPILCRKVGKDYVRMIAEIMDSAMQRLGGDATVSGDAGKGSAVHSQGATAEAIHGLTRKIGQFRRSGFANKSPSGICLCVPGCLGQGVEPMSQALVDKGLCPWGDSPLAAANKTGPMGPVFERVRREPGSGVRWKRWWWLHSAVSKDAGKDEQDVLAQAKAVSQALRRLGYEHMVQPFDGDVERLEECLQRVRAGLVFNLVETVGGSGRFIHWAPAWLERRGIPHTGSSAGALFATSNKIEAKNRMKAAGLPTPGWCVRNADCDGKDWRPGRFIVKSVWEHASVGLGTDSVIEALSPIQLAEAMELRGESLGGDCFAERYIEGREFNLSMLTGYDGPVVLPPAEIRFDDYPEGKVRIVDYRAKWEEDSFEFHHTPRTFDLDPHDAVLVEELKSLALGCWRLFDLKGYARVDFRVDLEGRPWILEVNANPCIAPDSGFVAAALRAGIDFREVIRRVLDDLVAGMPGDRAFIRETVNSRGLSSQRGNEQVFPPSA